MKKYFYLSVMLLLLLFSEIEVNLGQVNECAKKQKSPKYRVANSEYTVGENKILLLFISINPKLLNREDIEALARKIKCDFPNENELQASFFTSYDAAKTFSINPGSKHYVRNMKAFRGGYYLNRTSGKEYVSFSTIDKEPFDEEKIDLSKEKSNQCLSESESKNKKAIRSWYQNFATSEKRVEERRGTYVLDRAKNYEAIEFATQSDKPINEVRLEFSKAKKEEK